MNSFPCSRSDCDNKTEYGYCKSTVCINPMNLAVGYIPDVAIPDVAPVKHGRWIDCENDKWECSECGRIMWFSPRLDVKPSDYRFCPNCGAKMDGPETEETSNDA